MTDRIDIPASLPCSGDVSGQRVVITDAKLNDAVADAAA